MGTSYNYSEGATYQSEGTPITVSKIPTGEYKIKAVSEDGEGEYSYTAGPGTQSITLTMRTPQVYGFRIAIDEPDSSTRVTYPERIHGKKNLNYGFTPASGTGVTCMNDWDGCPLISGIHRQIGYGHTGWTDIANDAAWQAGLKSMTGGDMMTYVPTWYMKMTNDGTYIDCAFSEEQIDDTWLDYAGSVGSNRIGHFRVGCFAAYRTPGLRDDTKYELFSIGNQTPTTSESITRFIEYAKNCGTGYDIMTWYQWAYLTALAVLLYKSTDLQSAMAQGYVGGSGVQSETALTFSNDYGMAGGTSKTQQMSFFWIQNLWGNMFQWVGGAKTDSSMRLMTCTGYSSVTDSDFDKTALTAKLSSNIDGFISKVTGTTDTGFFPAECSGSNTTYFADRGSVRASYFPYVGGAYDGGGMEGPFLAYFYYGATDPNSLIGSRLSYRL